MIYKEIKVKWHLTVENIAPYILHHLLQQNIKVQFFLFYFTHKTYNLELLEIKPEHGIILTNLRFDKRQIFCCEWDHVRWKVRT